MKKFLTRKTITTAVAVSLIGGATFSTQTIFANDYGVNQSINTLADMSERDSSTDAMRKNLQILLDVLNDIVLEDYQKVSILVFSQLEESIIEAEEILEDRIFEDETAELNALISIFNTLGKGEARLRAAKDFDEIVNDTLLLNPEELSAPQSLIDNAKGYALAKQEWILLFDQNRSEQEIKEDTAELQERYDFVINWPAI